MDSMHATVGVVPSMSRKCTMCHAVLCVTFPNGKILIYFYSTFDREARKVMERIADVKVFDRSIEAVYGVF